MTFASKRLLISPSKLFYSDYVTVVQLDLPIHRQTHATTAMATTHGLNVALQSFFFETECCITELEAEVAKPHKMGLDLCLV